MPNYPNPDILAETDWLAEHIGDPDVVVVDCDEFQAYLRAHIDGAIALRTHHYLKGEADTHKPENAHIMPPEEFAAVMSRHGIGDDTTVVAYDGMGGLYAARLWWALDYYGHTKCKVLNGGFGKWFDEGRPVSRRGRRIQPAEFTVRAVREESCATLAEMKAAVDSGDTVIWDVRSAAEHSGDDGRPNKRHGHIPGAVHLEWLDLTAPPERSGLLLPANEIRRKLELAGITPEKRVLAH